MWLRIWLQYRFGERVTRAAAIEALVTLTSGAVRAALGGRP